MRKFIVHHGRFTSSSDNVSVPFAFSSDDLEFFDTLGDALHYVNGQIALYPLCPFEFWAFGEEFCFSQQHPQTDGIRHGFRIFERNV